jgi:23S rRNA (adenine1618-N6)-methyltransferase
MHSKNIHNTPYNFKELAAANPKLIPFVIINSQKVASIDFSDNKAVLELNKAILINHYNLNDWSIPNGYLCPPIPGRADYIHHISDFLKENKITKNINGLDIGVGANCIYPILASRIYNWKMVGADINETAITSATKNINATPDLKDSIEIRHQIDNANIFKGIINEGEYYNFSMCNPPFHTSEKEANIGTKRKLQNLGLSPNTKLNFGGQANELWCNGGEALFIKRMIKQSVDFKTQVGWFTCLVSKKDNLRKIYKQLDKVNATFKTIQMKQGNKQSRFVAWKFNK